MVDMEILFIKGKTMNWNLIKEKYPKCYSLLLIFLKGMELEDLQTTSVHPITKMRFLYDFFDEQGTYINILLFGKVGWTWDIRDRDFHVLAQPEFNDTKFTRVEAEAQAFLKAFELLEEKLK